MVLLSLSQCRLCRHIVMVSSLPSWCRLRVCHGHCSVTFIVASLRCHRCSRIIVVPLLSHRHCLVVTVAVSPLSSHCCHFVVAIMVSPSHLSWFHCCRRDVAFTSVAVLLLPSQCHLHISCSFIVAIAVSPSSSHCCGVVVA